MSNNDIMNLELLKGIAGFSGMEFGIFKLKEGVSESEMLTTNFYLKKMVF